MPNESPNFSQQRQQQNDNFLRAFFTSANEHSKRLTIIDTVIYVILIAALLVIIVLEPGLAPTLAEVISYISTAYVALRATYGLKAGLENFSKIRSSFNDIRNGMEISDDENVG